MNRISTPLLVVTGFLLLGGCAGTGRNAQTEDNSPVVAVIADERMTLKNFEDAYAKNNGGWEKGAAASLEERERFLDLLVKFKLKVREARERGLERDSSIQQELESYGASIATSYMLDKELVEPNIKKLYERREVEIRASHILIRFANTPPTPEDTAVAYQKAKEVIALVPTLPFDSLAMQYSRDQSVMMNRGDLGYFSSGRMVKEFEDAAYGMNVGEYNRVPVRTQFGYHIIKITDRRPASGSIRVSHILRRFSPTREDSTAVSDSAQAIYKLIVGGLDFAKAAQQFSEDPTTATRGGDLGFIDRSRIPEHIAADFYSKPVGTVFEPMRFPYGYHIFKTIEKKPVLPFSEVERELRNQYQANRYTDDYTAYLHGLKKKLQFSLDINTMYTFTHAFDTATTPSREGWSDTLDTDFLQRRLLTIGGSGYSVGDAVAYIKASEEFKKTLLSSQNVEKVIERFTEIKALEHEAKNLAERHPEFDRLMKEYEDGVLLFKIEQDEVWNKIDTSHAALRAYYEANLQQYQLLDRVNAQEILVKDTLRADSLYKRLKKGEDFGKLAQEYTVREGKIKASKGVWGDLDPQTHPVTEKAWAMVVDSICAPFKLPEGWAIVKTLSKQHARTKPFDEVATEVANSYREYASKQREQEWVDELKNKYGVTLSKGSLVEAFRRNQGETN
ncbi:MAG: peptidylprolyl isomerase [Ignavibacteriae bacterium]|nr:peptidylprolyl isomerase [Ignavibacteriota bacterium]